MGGLEATMTTATREPIIGSEAPSAEEVARHRLAQKIHYATGDGDALIELPSWNSSTATLRTLGFATSTPPKCS